ncbi:sialidase family protein [Streptomyces sp. 3213.3]|uniref:sialidase family protein n=1 Tax=Streptomyces sp. 3213.3 TaxID=1855348 RepID=UPI001041C583|nr:sialidase family protein [Streptomyces sp. 3213.3]
MVALGGPEGTFAMGAIDRRVSRRAFAGVPVAVLSWMAASNLPLTATPSKPGEDRVPRNVRATDDAFAAHIEPAIAVNPLDPRNLLAVCRVFVGYDVGVAAYTSFDGGDTWRARGLLPGLVPDFDGNPTVVFDSHGRAFVCCVVATQGPPRHGDVLMWRSDDGGRGFRPPTTAIAGGAGLVDHPSLTTGTGSRPPTTHLYLAAGMYGTATDGVVVARSTDGGRTFQPPLPLDPTAGAKAIAPVAAAGPEGSLTVAYVTPSSSGGVLLKAVTSGDRGETFMEPFTVAEVPAMAPGLGDVTAKSGPALAAADGCGLFCAAVTSFDDATGMSRLLLATMAGPNGPAPTWSEPMIVAASDEAVYLQPQIAIGDDHRIAISVYALSLATLRMDVLLHISDPVPPTSTPPVFGPPLRVTTRAFDPRQAIDTGSTHWLGNYQGLAAAPSHVFHPIWTDTRTGRAQIFTAAVRRHRP